LDKEKTISSKVIYEGRAVKLRIDTVINAAGDETTREIVEHVNCVAMVPVDSDGSILLVRQFRKALEKELLEIPAGGIDAGEDAEAAVKREMQEETGFLPRKLVHLGGLYSSPGFCTEYLDLYLVTDLKPARLYAEDTEGIEVVRVKPRQVRRLIRSGEVCDSKSVAGLLTYLDYLRKARKA
jgi:ADP-ribose pyrophosphatase